MEQIDFDIEENQKALRGLYAAIQRYELFWTNWLRNTIRPKSKSTACSEQELFAAEALDEALKAIARK